jgi:hypothetical protein
VTACDAIDSSAIELYFYDELDPAERARVRAHLSACEDCRQRLDDLHAIRRALASQARVDAPPAGDWSGFMRRLDTACAVPAIARPASAATPSRRSLRAALAVAAALIIVTAGVLVTVKSRSAQQPAPATAVQQTTPPIAPATKPVQAAEPAPARALAELSEQHFERSKLVVLGLAARDPEHTRSQDWQYERDLAGSLLSDTRLYRLAAQDHGLSDIAHVMGDLETVLLEASMTRQPDAAALERVQNLIRKRDLVVKMQVVSSSGI